MTRLALCGVIASLSLVACDGETMGTDGGMIDATPPTDSGGGGDCAGMADGTACGTGMVCVAEVCVTAGCGDGLVTGAEECDDGNTDAFDGCEPDCTFTCEADAACDDGLSCNGDETCGATTHVCEPGTAADPGTACSTGTGPAGVCRAPPAGATWVDAGGVNGVVDGAEDCDDMNETPGDGCETDCTFSCVADEDCDDFLNCTGTETCDTTTHVCQAGTALDCADGDDCTDDRCDDTVGGCINPLTDADMDGFASDSLGACGTDCDDARADVYPGAEELCDGVDNNCNLAVDEVAPTWYIDCDADGFAGSTDSSRMSCAAPPGSTTGCGGTWVSRRPVDDTNTDCDASHANMFPGQTMYFTSAHGPGATDDIRYGNYNCNGVAERDHTTTNARDGSCTLFRNFLSGSYSCSGTGWTTTATVPCGYSGDFVQCGSTVECIPGPRGCSTAYSLVCVGRSLLRTDPCYCLRAPCVPTCTPGTPGCPWRYLRCATVTPTTERMACR